MNTILSNNSSDESQFYVLECQKMKVHLHMTNKNRKLKHDIQKSLFLYIN